MSYRVEHGCGCLVMMGARTFQGASGCFAQYEWEGHLSWASDPLAAELIGQRSPIAANCGVIIYAQLSSSSRAFGTLSSENSRAKNKARVLYRASLNCSTVVITATFKIWEFYEKKVRFFNFLEKLEDLAALDPNSPVAPNCQSQEALPGHTRSQSRQSPP